MNWQSGTPTAGMHRASAELQAIERRLAALENVVSISPSGEVVIQATRVRIKGTSEVIIDGQAAVKVESGGVASIDGALVTLNKGGQPVARQGDTVPPTGGPIISGNPTVLA